MGNVTQILRKERWSMILDDIIEVGKKFLPDKDKKLEYEIEMRKLNLDEFKEKKGIFTRMFHLVFPFMTLSLTGMYVVEFYLRCRQYLHTGDWITTSIVPAGMELLVLVFLSLLMPRKLLEPIVAMIIRYLENKVKK